MITSLLSRAQAWRRVRRMHFEAIGRWPRLSPPVTLNEHIIHRILYDRDPRLKTISDKIAVKDFIAGRRKRYLRAAGRRRRSGGRARAICASARAPR